jgi:hypothetical protein
MSDTSINEPKKRPVGRPKMAKNEKKTTHRKGIVYEPQINDHVIELVYDTPTNFKRIFTLFKLMDTRDIRFEFRLKDVKITGVGHLQQNYIELVIDGSKLTQYYCKHNITINLDQKNIEKIIQKIDKSYDSIYIIAKEDSYKKNINIILNDDKQGIREYHKISLIEDMNNIEDDIISKLKYEDYPLSFTLPSKYFKKVINDISKFTNDFTIERSKGVLLSFPYDSNAKTLDCYNLYSNDQLFNIQSSLDENDFLSTTVRIEYIQSMATSLLSEEVTIFVDKEQMMVFKSIIDNGTFELILTAKIVSYRT